MLREGGPSSGTIDNPYFAVVVGTGFGGAVVACRLAQAAQAERASRSSEKSRSILVMERGRRYERSDFGRLKLPDYLVPRSTATSKPLPEIARLFWEHDHGLWDLRNLGELRLVQAAGYGGGSLIYANVHLRPPESSFAPDKWQTFCDSDRDCRCRDELRPPPFDRNGLRPYYDRVAAMLDLSRIPPDARPPKTHALKKMAGIVGGDKHFLYPPLAITFETPPGGKNRFDRPQSACTSCGDCTIGCPVGAKNTLDLNYLAVAEDLGAQVRTLSEVQTIRPFQQNGAELLRITYIDHLIGEDLQVVAKHVFLCAGAAGSTAILMRSADRSKPDATDDISRPPSTSALRVPDALGENFFANGDSIGVAFDTKMQIDGAYSLAPSVGPTITAALVYGGTAARSGKDWFLVEDGGIPTSVAQALGVLRSPLWGARNRFAAPGKGQTGPLAHALEVLHAARGYWLADVDPPPSAALARALKQLVPIALGRVVADLAGAATQAQGEINAIVKGTLPRVDATLGFLLRKVRACFVPDTKVHGPANAATAALHPLTTELLASNRPMDYALAVLRFLLLGAPVNENTMVLLCMGPDHPGRLRWRRQRLRIEWNLGQENLLLYDTQERLMRDAGKLLGGELRTNPDWTVGRKPVTVHAQGGCGMSGHEQRGVTTPCGRLWTSEHIYVMDGSTLPSSVGVNPSSTIAAVAERNIELFIRREIPGGAAGYTRMFKRGSGDDLTPRENFDDSLGPKLPAAPEGVPSSLPVGLSWYEEVSGNLAAPGDPARLDTLERLQDGPLRKDGTVIDRGYFRSLERRGRLAGTPVVMKLDVAASNLESLTMQDTPTMTVSGKIVIGGAKSCPPITIDEGWLRMDMEDAPGGKRSSRWWVRPRRLRGMTYCLHGGGLSIVATKTIEDDPGIDFWNDLSTLYTLVKYDDPSKNLAGIVRVHLPDFVSSQLRKMQVGGNGLDDDFVKTWGFIRFAQFFFGSIRNAYSDWGTGT